MNKTTKNSTNQKKSHRLLRKTNSKQPWINYQQLIYCSTNYTSIFIIFFSHSLFLSFVWIPKSSNLVNKKDGLILANYLNFRGGEKKTFREVKEDFGLDLLFNDVNYVDLIDFDVKDDSEHLDVNEFESRIISGFVKKHAEMANHQR